MVQLSAHQSAFKPTRLTTPKKEEPLQEILLKQHKQHKESQERWLSVSQAEMWSHECRFHAPSNDAEDAIATNQETKIAPSALLPGCNPPLTDFLTPRHASTMVFF